MSAARAAGRHAAAAAVAASRLTPVGRSARRACSSTTTVASSAAASAAISRLSPSSAPAAPPSPPSSLPAAEEWNRRQWRRRQQERRPFGSGRNSYVPPAYRVHDEDDGGDDSGYNRYDSSGSSSSSARRGGGVARRSWKKARRVRGASRGARRGGGTGRGGRFRGGSPSAPGDRRRRGGRPSETSTRHEREETRVKSGLDERGSGGGFGEAWARVVSLLWDEARADDLRRAYEESVRPSDGGVGGDGGAAAAPPTLDRLRDSEAAYRAYGAALRSLASGWAAVRSYHHGGGPAGVRALSDLLREEGPDDPPSPREKWGIGGPRPAGGTPYDRASRRLRALENLREGRLAAISAAVEAERERKRAAADTGGVWGRVASLFTAAMTAKAAEDDDGDDDGAEAAAEEYRRLTEGLSAHSDRACAADAALCHAVMKSAIHWHNVAERAARAAWYGDGDGDATTFAYIAEFADDGDGGNESGEGGDDDEAEGRPDPFAESRAAAAAERRRRDTRRRPPSGPDRSRAFRARVASSRRAAGVLADDLTAALRRMNSAASEGNELMRPTREIYDTVIESCAKAGTIQRAMVARGLLRSMRREEGACLEAAAAAAAAETAAVSEDSSASSSSLLDSDSAVGGSQPSPPSLAPTLQTYLLVFKAYREAADGIGRGEHDGGGGRRGRRKAALQAESLLHQMEEEAAGRGGRDSGAAAAVVPNAAAYNLVLTAMANAGHDAVPDLVDRAEALAGRMMAPPGAPSKSKGGAGRRAFRAWLSDGFGMDGDGDGGGDTDSAEPPAVAVVPDMPNCHRLVEIFASAGTRPSVEKARALLKRMEEFRDLGGMAGAAARGVRVHGRDSLSATAAERAEVEGDEEAERGGEGADREEAEDGDGDDGGAAPADAAVGRDNSGDVGWSFPNTNTYNAVARGLLRVAYAERRSGGAAVDAEVVAARTEDDAAYVTELLDRTVGSPAAAPNRATYHYALRLWSKSGSAHAGERAEEILSRMEVRDACLRAEGQWGGDGSNGGGGGGGTSTPAAGGSGAGPDLQTYQNVLQCWEEAARAGRPGAAGRVTALLDRMEGQCRLPPRGASAPASPSALASPWQLPPSLAEAIDSCYNDESARPQRFVYNSALAACAAASEEEEPSYDARSDGPDDASSAIDGASSSSPSPAPAALRAAFGAYNRMIERGVEPSSETYALLLTCCARLLPGGAAAEAAAAEAAAAAATPILPTADVAGGGGGEGEDEAAEAAAAAARRRRLVREQADRRTQLSRTVFEAACDSGKVSRRVLAQLKEANRAMFDSYRPVPRHSARLRE